MAQRSGFDMSKLSTADKILLGGSLAFVIDSFLPWQRVCFSFGAFGNTCGSASAWGGNAGWAGLLASLCAIALLIWEGLSVAGVNLGDNLPGPTISAGLVGGTVLFTLLKFLLIVSKKIFLFGFLGLIIALVIAYGGYMKMQEPKATTPPPATGGGGFTA